MVLTPEQTWLFRTAGFVKLPERLPPDTVAALRDAINQDIENAVEPVVRNREGRIVRLSNALDRAPIFREVVTSSRQAFDISEDRFRQGTIDLVTLLQTQQTLFQALDTLAQAQLARVQAIVGLYQALGGGWLPKPREALKCTVSCGSRT